MFIFKILVNNGDIHKGTMLTFYIRDKLGYQKRSLDLFSGKMCLFLLKYAYILKCVCVCVCWMLLSKLNKFFSYALSFIILKLIKLFHLVCCFAHLIFRNRPLLCSLGLKCLIKFLPGLSIRIAVCSSKPNWSYFILTFRIIFLNMLGKTPSVFLL